MQVHRAPWPVVLALATTPAALATAASAQCELAALVGSDTSAGDVLGSAVAIDGTRCIVGARGKDAVYLFERGPLGWQETAQFPGFGGFAGLGTSVAIRGDRAIAGAPNQTDTFTSQGQVHVYERTGAGWVQAALLKASDPDAFAHFGNRVDIEGDVAVVGCDRDASVYVFERQAGVWTQTQKLLTGAAAADGGPAVALWGDVLVAGKVQDHDVALWAGAAVVFERNATGTFVSMQKLTSAQGQSFDYLGRAVDVERDRILLGAPGNLLNPGSANVFERQGGVWVEVDVIQGVAAGDSLFAQAVALDGDTALVGAPEADLLGVNEVGAAHLFHKGPAGWAQTAIYHSAQPKAFDHFGESVALSSGQALVGAPEADIWGLTSGSATLFGLPGSSFVFLDGAPGSLSLAAGGAQALAVRTCPPQPGAAYQVLGTFAGVSPGMRVAGLLLPLNPGLYFTHTLTSPNRAPLSDSLGVLDAAGTATATFALPAASDPALAGLTAHHACVVFDAPGGTVELVSAATPLALGP